MRSVAISSNISGSYALNGVRNDGKEIAVNVIPDELLASVNTIAAYVDAFQTDSEKAEQQALDFVALNATNEELVEMTDAFPLWRSGLPVKLNQVYNYLTILYKVLQEHTTQSDWTPDITPALWLRVNPPDVVPEWVQPTGAHDAYNIGDHVMFNSVEYVSIINANAWSPIDYPAGWAIV